MVGNILSQKVILLRKGLIAKLLLSDAWPTSMDFPNFLDILAISVTQLHHASAYNFSLLTTNPCWEHHNSWYTSEGCTSTQRRICTLIFRSMLQFFCMKMLSTINGGRNRLFYVLPKSVCSTTNNYFPIEDIYSGLIWQHALSNILNVYQRFIKSLHQPTKPHGLVGQFPNRQKVKK